MKKYLMWSFERGSRPYDAICFVILAFIFLTPSWAFHDRPDYMRITKNAEVMRNVDDDGATVYTIQLHNVPLLTPAKTAEKTAIDRLHQVLREPFTITHTEPIYDSIGAL